MLIGAHELRGQQPLFYFEGLGEVTQGRISHCEGGLGHVSPSGEHPGCSVNPNGAEMLLQGLTSLPFNTSAQVRS